MTPCALIQATKIYDNRGYTLLFEENNPRFSYSFSREGVIRGLHFHTSPIQKIIHLLSGEIFDVLVNLKTGEWTGHLLNTQCEILCPEFYAHGFLAITDATIAYKWIPYWDTESGKTLRWFDESLGISWNRFYNENGFVLSDNDKNNGISLQEAMEYFK